MFIISDQLCNQRPILLPLIEMLQISRLQCIMVIIDTIKASFKVSTKQETIRAETEKLTICGVKFV